MIESATVSNHPCQKALRYFQIASQLRVVEASNVQLIKEKTISRRATVAAFAQRGAGERALSRKLPSKLLTRLPSSNVTHQSIRLSLCRSWERIERPTCFPGVFYHPSCGAEPAVECHPARRPG